MDAVRTKVLPALHSTIVQACCITVGWWIQELIYESLMVEAFDSEVKIRKMESTRQAADVDISAENACVCSLFTFLFGLVGAALMPVFFHKVCLCCGERLQTVVFAGLVHVPAWSYKNFTDDFLTLLASWGWYETDTQYVLCAVLALIVGLFLALTAEVAVHHFEKGHIIYKCVSPVRTCVALGVAYAINNIFYIIFPCLTSFACPHAYVFNIIYAIIMTIAMPLATVPLRKKLEDPEALPLVLEKSFELMVDCAGFIVGWAWKGVLDLVLTPFFPLPIALALSITAVCVVTMLVVSAAGCLSAKHTEFVGKATSLNTGWAWMDYSSTIAVISMGDLWSAGLMCMWVAIVIAIFTEYALHREDASPAESTPLLEAPTQSLLKKLPAVCTPCMPGSSSKAAKPAKDS